jgi:hypothetical protein
VYPCDHLSLSSPCPRPLPPQYSDALKTELDYSQSGIELVSSLTNLGGYTAVAAGLALDRWGPAIPGTIGLCLMSLG